MGWAVRGGSAVNSGLRGEGGTDPSPGSGGTLPARDRLIAESLFWVVKAGGSTGGVG